MTLWTRNYIEPWAWHCAAACQFMLTKVKLEENYEGFKMRNFIWGGTSKNLKENCAAACQFCTILNILSIINITSFNHCLVLKAEKALLSNIYHICLSPCSFLYRLSLPKNKPLSTDARIAFEAITPASSISNSEGRTVTPISVTKHITLYKWNLVKLALRKMPNNT